MSEANVIHFNPLCSIVSYNVYNWKDLLGVLFVYVNLKALPKNLNVMNWEELKIKVRETLGVH